MFRDWDAYDCHPVIGPLIEEYRQHIREMEYVKNGLRTEDNIHEVMQMSAEAAEIKREIHGLMQIEEQARANRQRDTVWLFTTAAAIAVGILNIGIALF